MQQRSARGAAPRKKSSEKGLAPIRGVLDDLRKIVRDLRVTARSAEREAGISGAQLFVLQVLADGGVASVNAIAERTFTDQSSVSVAVRRLADQGFVVRKASTDDARKAELQITAAGRALLRKCPEPMQTRMVAALQRMKAADLDALRRGLGALVVSVGLDAEEARMFFEEDATPPRKSGVSANKRRAS